MRGRVRGSSQSAGRVKGEQGGGQRGGGQDGDMAGSCPPVALVALPSVGALQTWPQPVEQHFLAPGQSPSASHSSWQGPREPRSTTGHAPGFAARQRPRAPCPAVPMMGPRPRGPSSPPSLPPSRARCQPCPLLSRGSASGGHGGSGPYPGRGTAGVRCGAGEEPRTPCPQPRGCRACRGVHWCARSIHTEQGVWGGTCVRGGAGQAAAGEAALVVPGAVPVVSAAAGARGHAAPRSLPRAEAGFGCRGAEAQGAAWSPLALQHPCVPAQRWGAVDPWLCHTAFAAQGRASPRLGPPSIPWPHRRVRGVPGGRGAGASPGCAGRQRAQQLWAQHFSAGPQAVSLPQLAPQLAPLGPARGQ